MISGQQPKPLTADEIAEITKIFESHSYFEVSFDNDRFRVRKEYRSIKEPDPFTGILREINVPSALFEDIKILNIAHRGKFLFTFDDFAYNSETLLSAFIIVFRYEDFRKYKENKGTDNGRNCL